MPKMKTHRGAAKRVTQTGSGKYKRRHTSRRHIMSPMSTKRKRHLRKQGHIHPSDETHFERLLPYGNG